MKKALIIDDDSNILTTLEMYLEDIYTTSANLVGIPGISIPIGHSKEGLPIGMQLMAKQFEELTLLQFSQVFDR